MFGLEISYLFFLNFFQKNLTIANATAQGSIHTMKAIRALKLAINPDNKSENVREEIDVLRLPEIGKDIPAGTVTASFIAAGIDNLKESSIGEDADAYIAELESLLDQMIKVMGGSQKNVVLETFNGTVTMSMEEVEILDKILNGFIVELNKELNKESDNEELSLSSSLIEFFEIIPAVQAGANCRSSVPELAKDLDTFCTYQEKLADRAKKTGKVLPTAAKLVYGLPLALSSAPLAGLLGVGIAGQVAISLSFSWMANFAAGTSSTVEGSVETVINTLGDIKLGAPVLGSLSSVADLAGKLNEIDSEEIIIKDKDSKDDKLIIRNVGGRQSGKLSLDDKQGRNPIKPSPTTIYYGLAVSKQGKGTITGDDIACGSDCSATFGRNEKITLTASPDEGYLFKGWSGSCSGTDDCEVSMNTNKKITANFEKEKIWKLTVKSLGSGMITADPGNRDCSKGCTLSVADGKTLTLQASENEGYIFAGWSGACSGTEGCEITMNKNEVVTATFEKEKTWQLTVRTSEGAKVMVNPGNRDCSKGCTLFVADGKKVTLKAPNSPNYEFKGWGGACSGTYSCSVLMDRHNTVTALFEPYKTYTLTVDIYEWVDSTFDVAGKGRVLINPQGKICGANCDTEFIENTGAILYAYPNKGSEFVGWHGGVCDGQGACQILMNSNKLVNAIFQPDIEVDLFDERLFPPETCYKPGPRSCAAECVNVHASQKQTCVYSCLEDDRNNWKEYNMCMNNR